MAKELLARVGLAHNFFVMREIPLVSVIVPVFNGLPFLHRQIDGILRQKFTRPWEALYVDNGSTDGSREVVEAAAKISGGVIRYIDGSQSRGQVYARNLGVKEARADWLVFNDQDDIQAEDWLEQMVEALAKEDAVAGFVQITGAGREPDGFAAERSSLPLRYFGKIPIALGTNFGVKRHVLTAVGGWRDIDSEVHAGEDLDLCLRLAKNGHVLGYAPQAHVIWRARKDARGAFKQGYTYGRADVLIFAKHHANMGLKRSGVLLMLKGWAQLVLGLLSVLVGRERWPVLTRNFGWKIGRLVQSVKSRCLFW